MVINRKTIIVLGLAGLIGLPLVWWLIFVFSELNLNQRRILFEVWHGNAWNGSVAGFYVDSEGDVYTFENESQTPFESFYRGKPPYSANELFRYYGNSSQLVDRLNINTLKDMIELIQPASMGPIDDDDPLTPVICDNSDAGVYKYVAYLYDPDLKTHTPVELYTMGDFKRVNLSEDGKALYSWLENTCVENSYFSGCNPGPSICRP